MSLPEDDDNRPDQHRIYARIGEVRLPAGAPGRSRLLR